MAVLVGLAAAAGINAICVAGAFGLQKVINRK